MNCAFIQGMRETAMWGCSTGNRLRNVLVRFAVDDEEESQER
jgi:hypothetical protein